VGLRTPADAGASQSGEAGGMVKERRRSRLVEAIRIPATWAGETVFVFAAIVFGLIAAGALIGLNPLTSPVVMAVLVVILVVFVGRGRWYRRHREEFERSNVSRERRERRGF
jgi:O-antigen/teichoic acid export membrane protein